MKFEYHTFGCKVNTYDTGVLQNLISHHDHRESSSEDQLKGVSKIHILNTCAVTREATRDCLALARRLKARDPDCLVVATGCGAQVDTDFYAQLDDVDLVVANSHKMQIHELIMNLKSRAHNQKIFKSNIFKKEALESGGGIEQSHTRSFLKIQDGCNSFCSFCVIPFARGKSRSLPATDLVDQIQRLVGLGVGEVVLTGVHIGDYRHSSERSGSLRLSKKRGVDLCILLENILEKTSVERIRLSSLEPIEISDELLDLFRKEDRICPHFHLSIQSASSDVLRLMRRKYRAEDVEFCLHRIATDLPHAFVGMDIIAGFPAESDLHFAESMKLLERTQWSRLHVFPYSIRPDTKAALMADQIDRRQIHLRALELRQLSEIRWKSHALKQIGSVKPTLILGSRPRSSLASTEISTPPMVRSLSRDFWSIYILGGPNHYHSSPVRGTEVQVQVTGLLSDSSKPFDGQLMGQLYQ